MKQSKDGRYHTSFRWEGKTYSVVGKTEAEVHRKIGRKKAELESGRVTKPKRVTVRQYASEWAETYKAGSDDYKSIVKKHIVPALGDLYLRDVTEATLQNFLNRKAEDLSPSRVHKIKLTLSQMFHKAKKNHLITDDPAEDLVLPEPIPASSRRSITDLERALLLQVLPGHRGEIYCKLMLYCGLRPGEVNVLQWKHIYNNTVHVRQALKHNSTAIGLPKSDAGIRDVPMPQQMIDALPDPGDPEAYVASWTGRPITRAAQSRMWASVRREMDILAGAKLDWAKRHQKAKPLSTAIIVESALADDLDLYCLRHTYCTDLQKAGVPINIARELMGHSSIEVTARIYTHTGTEETAAAVEKLEQSVSGPSNIVFAKFGT